ncbi:DUF1642 domain-containing protein [Streptococcus agalactiae]|uniref:DUF1642 domain-containing protein n=1 Tax=Streptococcus agalactiae TaxID=1311 RepID=UPI000A6CC95D|nr:DUF1642 domain-containing protein [Streptococcus agalactiae]
MIEQIQFKKTYYLPVRVTEFNHEVGDEEPTVRLVNLSGRHQLVDFEQNIMNELVEIDLRIDQPKPEVSQCAIDWVNDSREFDYDFDEWFYYSNQPLEVYKWLNCKNKRQADINALALVTLIVNGPDAVTVEKEKLYTVEIPNPNTPAITVLARSIVGDVVMCNEFDTCWKNNSRYQLTEQEIRKDFDWAWQQKFQKEVANEL